jgi:hypothetical protein
MYGLASPMYYHVLRTGHPILYIFRSILFQNFKHSIVYTTHVDVLL